MQRKATVTKLHFEDVVAKLQKDKRNITSVQSINTKDFFYKWQHEKIRLTTGDEKACIIKRQGDKLDVALNNIPWNLRCDACTTPRHQPLPAR